jgi:hypothetical protein
MICCCRVSLCTLCCRARVNSDSIVDCRAFCSLSHTDALSLSRAWILFLSLSLTDALSLTHRNALSHTRVLSLSRADALSLTQMLFLSHGGSLTNPLFSLSCGLLSYSRSSYFLL